MIVALAEEMVAVAEVVAQTVESVAAVAKEGRESNCPGPLLLFAKFEYLFDRM